ncbi:hypothetical protein JQX13_09940 [Archangium violaceum]|uniref:hypothetical protein n=1 Tax=Archangium violaceum TaxID=83451 RepID=UPI00193BF7E7|nr:hypothetical protein [Archangium violaceum]QRK10376.1 hypothetical protein JQX13_09940 [Archangium violaceum]
MSSEWAQEAERQARAITRDLVEVGKVKGFRVLYQKREARFVLRARTTTAYFSAHDYQTPKGMDWLQLRIDILTRVRRGMLQDAQEESAPAP